MILEILTPDKKVFDGNITSVTVPGTQGSFEVLNNHAPIISTLEKGKVIVRNGSNEQKFLITGGVIEVINNKIILLAESAQQQ
ncbi:ATP synthase F1 subcomplex epsilon subunit [Pseudopedobacter saltans DSM 12145]|uniref:ATP synthase F1 subcomplex epsilon subunit n=1 Tax=Pseudopedobacter saltans (strain ATCC 51119 / DSM 12145 / JCM 21818 / CCUG 39354 / LMG 10337 / NBRC 100064 / NCIMB 13643) TaxID=762903 RepID=F0SDA9_PSESL|nr:ATP synthase F1 subunit epsilon [Pseudopedobacter saltans]ADY52895.1 ATP synthase F1 subcomplex epsilon subunit [Pseudopedobacter saltans DSM 12145]